MTEVYELVELYPLNKENNVFENYYYIIIFYYIINLFIVDNKNTIKNIFLSTNVALKTWLI